jgi:rare lipoprotein A
MPNFTKKNIFLLIIGSTLLFGCQTANIKDTDVVVQKNQQSDIHTKKPENYIPTKKDSAPIGAPPITFKEVKPVDSPLSRYGNPATYAVDGQKYNVMPSANGYHASGIASWYGTKFHTKRTSSGEKYDMYALTAAHKTLPLPTYIRVKNLDNGKSAVIKVNDRGPFHPGRILDLSYGAANKLGIFPKGTANVEIEAITKKKNYAHYYLQVGAFESGVLAEKLKEDIEQYSPNMVFITEANDKFLVRVGPFVNKKMSDNLKRLLNKKGLPGVFSMIM